MKNCKIAKMIFEIIGLFVVQKSKCSEKTKLENFCQNDKALKMLWRMSRQFDVKDVKTNPPKKS